MLEFYREPNKPGDSPLTDKFLALQRTQMRVANLYHHSLMRGWLGSVWARLARRPNELQRLPPRRPGCEATRISKVRAVPIAQIVGSEDRAGDFDRTFAPLQQHTRARWLSVATAWALGQPLPAVELIQIGEDYYVRDGHHRISVACAFGQHEVDAMVLVWQAAQLPQTQAAWAAGAA